MKRPEHLRAPAYLSKSPPLPSPTTQVEEDAPIGEGERPDPTRYGDWEKNGVAIDF